MDRIHSSYTRARPKFFLSANVFGRHEEPASRTQAVGSTTGATSAGEAPDLWSGHLNSARPGAVTQISLKTDLSLNISLLDTDKLMPPSPFRKSRRRDLRGEIIESEASHLYNFVVTSNVT
jgi:hypothetical protein